jgi:hypothetical protein
VDAFTAQYRAVVATAQLAAALPDVDFSIRVATHGERGARRWAVSILWQDGPQVGTIQRVLDGPPPGVHLLRQVGVPERDPDRD